MRKTRERVGVSDTRPRLTAFSSDLKRRWLVRRMMGVRLSHCSASEPAGKPDVSCLSSCVEVFGGNELKRKKGKVKREEGKAERVGCKPPSVRLSAGRGQTEHSSSDGRGRWWRDSLMG